jgi:DnaJ-domain-containing protein 1
MWQILNRISRIIQSNTTGATNNYKVFESEDDELKRIIDELNSDKSRNNKEQQSNYQNAENDDVMKAFNTLGIPPNSDAQAIKTAYRNKMKEYHPDRFVKLDKELQEKSRIKSQAINIAYDVLQKAGYVK